MPSRLLRVAVLFVLAVPAVSLAQYRTSAWIPPWSNDALTSIQQNASRITESNPVWYNLDSSGNIIKNANAENPTWRAAMAGTEIFPAIQNFVNGDWAGNVVQSIVNDPVKREAHAEKVTQLVIAQAFDGIDIDYEALPGTARAGFSEFVRILAAKLHSVGKRLSVTVHAKTSDSANWNGPAGQDYAAIGTWADYVKIMTYDYHWSTSDPGPISPLDWVNSVLTFAKSQMPAGKIAVGVHWYGYDWSGRNADSLTHAEAVARALANNATITHDINGEATYKYGARTVFFQDAFSYNKRADTVVQNHGDIGGFSHWASGQEDPLIWTRVEALKNGGTPPEPPPTEPPPPAPVPPAAPSSLFAQAASRSAINLTWSDNSPDETGFTIERCSGYGCTSFGVIATVATGTTSYADSGLSKNRYYTYRVRAIRETTVSAYSNSAVAQTYKK